MEIMLAQILEQDVQREMTRLVYHDLYLSINALVERENVGFDLNNSDLCPFFIEDHTAKGGGLRVTNSHTGNHHEDDFTTLETIRRFLAYGGEPSVDLLRAFLNLGPPDFMSFMMEGIDGEFHFKPEGGVGDGEGSCPSIKSINNKALVIDAEPLNSARPLQFAENIMDSDDASSKKDVADEARNQKLGKPSKATGKKGDSPKGSKEVPSAKELKDPSYCHWVVAHAVLVNMLNNKTCKLISTLTKARASCDAIRERVETLQGQGNRLHDEYSRLILKENKWANYEETLAILHSKVEGAVVVVKVVPHVSTELVHSDEMGLLVARLAKSALFHGRCTTLEEVAALKEPFKLEKMPCYRPLSKK
nr:hypothetical protein [Tanacetum cinerariifolium]